MRELKYGDRPEAERDRVAEGLRAAGRREEALLLYEGRPDHPCVTAELAWARERGCGFHLLAIRRLGREVSRADFEATGRAAEAAGRWLEARHCWKALEDAGALERIAPHLPPSLRPPPAATTETA
jgi:hypothetical protein